MAISGSFMISLINNRESTANWERSNSKLSTACPKMQDVLSTTFGSQDFYLLLLEQ